MRDKTERSWGTATTSLMAGKPGTSITGVNDRLCLRVLPSNHRPRARDNSICRGQFPSFTWSTFSLRHVPAEHRFFICHGGTLGGLLPAVVGTVAFGRTIGAPSSQNLLQQDLSEASSSKMADICLYCCTSLHIVAAGSAIFQQFGQRKIDWESIEWLSWDALTCSQPTNIHRWQLNDCWFCL